MPRKKNTFQYRHRRYRARPKKAAMDKPATKAYVQRAIRAEQELKQAVYTYADAFPVSNTVGQTYTLNLPQGPATVTSGVVSTDPGEQGVGGYQHIGNQINIKQVSFKCRITRANAALSGPNIADGFVRMMLVTDRGGVTDGTIPTTSEILTLVTAGKAVYAHYEQAEKPRFRILMDRIIPFRSIGIYGNGSDPPSGQEVVQYINITKKVNIKTHYYSDTSSVTVTGIQRGGIWAIFFADNVYYSINDANSSILYTDS